MSSKLESIIRNIGMVSATGLLLLSTGLTPTEVSAFSLFQKKHLSEDYPKFEQQVKNFDYESFKNLAKQAKDYNEESQRIIANNIRDFLDKNGDKIKVNVVIEYEQDDCRNTPLCFTHVNAGSTGYDNSTINLPGGPTYQDLYVTWARAMTVTEDDRKAVIGAIKFSDKNLIEMMARSNVGRMRREKTLDLAPYNTSIPYEVAYNLLSKQIIDDPSKSYQGPKTMFTEQDTLGGIMGKPSTIDHTRRRHPVDSYVQLVFNPIGTPEPVPKERQTTSYK